MQFTAFHKPITCLPPGGAKPPPFLPSVSNFPLIHSFFFPTSQSGFDNDAKSHTPPTQQKTPARESRASIWMREPTSPSSQAALADALFKHPSELPSSLHYEKSKKRKDARWRGTAGRPRSSAGLICKHDKLLHFYSFQPVRRIILRQNYNYGRPGFPTEPRVSAERRLRHTERGFFFSGHYYSSELESLWMLRWVQKSYY